MDTGNIATNLQKTSTITRMMYTQNEIAKFKGSSKQLHKLIAELTGSKVENPLPEGLSDEDLAKHFANFVKNLIITHYIVQ